jgi:hypothetical protein
MPVESQAVAQDLSEWFESVRRLTDASLFSIAPEGPHRNVLVLDALRRYARSLYGAEMDREGRLYSPLCFFLAAACRYLGTNLGMGHWRAALENLRDWKRSMDSRPEQADVGLNVGGPAMLFKMELDEAIRQSGLTDGVSFLSKDDRQVAVALAVNWGIRLLLSYSLEVSHSIPQPGRKDLAWLADRVMAALSE